MKLKIAQYYLIIFIIAIVTVGVSYTLYGDYIMSPGMIYPLMGVLGIGIIFNITYMERKLQFTNSIPQQEIQSQQGPIIDSKEQEKQILYKNIAQNMLDILKKSNDTEFMVELLRRMGYDDVDITNVFNALVQQGSINIKKEPTIEIPAEEKKEPIGEIPQPKPQKKETIKPKAQCKICGKEFKDKRGLNLHMMKSHKEEWENAKANNTS